MMNSGSSVGHGSAGEGWCSHRPLDLTSTPARVPQNAIMTSDYAPLDPWYLAGPKKDGTDEGIGGSSFSDWFTSLGKYFLLIYGLIPISLYVSMALVRNADGAERQQVQEFVDLIASSNGRAELIKRHGARLEREDDVQLCDTDNITVDADDVNVAHVRCQTTPLHVCYPPPGTPIVLEHLRDPA